VEQRKSITFGVEAPVLRSALHNALTHAAQGAARPQLASVLFDLDASGLRVMATDFYRLIVQRVATERPLPAGDGAWHLPRETAKEWLRLLRGRWVKPVTVSLKARTATLAIPAGARKGGSQDDHLMMRSGLHWRYGGIPVEPIRWRALFDQRGKGTVGVQIGVNTRLLSALANLWHPRTGAPPKKSHGDPVLFDPVTDPLKAIGWTMRWSGVEEGAYGDEPVTRGLIMPVRIA
jgi:hypothetical protein